MITRGISLENEYQKKLERLEKLEKLAQSSSELLRLYQEKEKMLHKLLALCHKHLSSPFNDPAERRELISILGKMKP